MPRVHRNTRRYHVAGVPNFSIFYGPLRDMLLPLCNWTDNLELWIRELQQSQRELERELESLRWARGTFPQTRELNLERTHLWQRIEAIKYLIRQLAASVSRSSGRWNFL